MKIRFRKKTEIDGQIWFFVDVDNVSQKATQDEKIAKEYYLQLVANAKSGLPLEETIEETTINTK